MASEQEIEAVAAPRRPKNEMIDTPLIAVTDPRMVKPTTSQRGLGRSSPYQTKKPATKYRMFQRAAKPKPTVLESALPSIDAGS